MTENKMNILNIFQRQSTIMFSIILVTNGKKNVDTI